MIPTDRLTAHRQTDQRALVEIIQRPSVRAGSPVENLSVRFPNPDCPGRFCRRIKTRPSGPNPVFRIRLSVNCFIQLITHARSQDLGLRTSIFGSGPGSQDLNARFQDLDLRTWVSGPQREVSGPGSQNLGFRPSVFGSQDLGFRTSKALHPTVVLYFSRHFSLRPVVTDRQTAH